MTLHYEDQLVKLHHGDCLDVLRTLPDASVDAVVTDPPYGLEFMGREWDGADGFRRSLNPADVERDNPFGRTSRTSPEYRAGHLFQEWSQAWATECLRVLKPGGHLLAFGGTRTSHRLACAIEDAGFEIRDSIAWLYGSGFPKSLDVSKAIDKAAGVERGEGTPRVYADGATFGPREQGGKRAGIMGETVPRLPTMDTAPATPDAERWQGWGTALKPAHEPVVVARKPLGGTVAANVLTHGTGALNIDATRTATTDDLNGGAYAKVGNRSESASLHAGSGMNVPGKTAGKEYEQPAGRWPANVILDESQAAALDEQSGDVPGAVSNGHKGKAGLYEDGLQPLDQRPSYADNGGASRFFYCAKAPAWERPRINGVAHPTVKPLSLMRWLVRLVTPPGGTVLEPFAGSGTTVEACILEGFHCLAIERGDEYLPHIEYRINRGHHPPPAEKPRPKTAPPPEQDSLFEGLL